MNRENKTILAISPYLGRTGSEISLLNLLNSILNEFNTYLYSENQNPILKPKFNKEITYFYSQLTNERLLVREFYRIKSFFSKKLKQKSFIQKLILKNKIDIVLLNTLLSVQYYKEIQKLDVKTIIYIHETELLLTRTSIDQLEWIINKSDYILCSSHYVKDYITILGRKKNIGVLYPGLDFSKFQLATDNINPRKILGFNKKEFIWGMSGDLTINKNPKAFIEIAKIIIKKYNFIRFVWLGVGEKNAYYIYLQKLLLSEGLEKLVLFVDKQDTDYYEYLNIIDAFVLTSSYESFSLVAKEASCFKIPVVSFPCGGVEEAVPQNNLYLTEGFSNNEIIAQMEYVISLRNNDEVPYNEKDLENIYSNELSIIKTKFINILRSL